MSIEKWWQEDAKRVNALSKQARKLGVLIDVPAPKGKKSKKKTTINSGTRRSIGPGGFQPRSS